MDKDKILETLRSQSKQLHGFDVKSLSLFGSVARNEAGPNSDIDILVEFKGPATFDGYMGLKFFLEDLLQRPTDLVTPKAIRPTMRDSIYQEAIKIA